MFHYINDTIKINFDLPNDILEFIKKIEQYDKEDNYGLYNTTTSFMLDVICKEACRVGDITMQQWETLYERYLL